MLLGGWPNHVVTGKFDEKSIRSHVCRVHAIDLLCREFGGGRWNRVVVFGCGCGATCDGGYNGCDIYRLNAWRVQPVNQQKLFESNQLYEWR